MNIQLFTILSLVFVFCFGKVISQNKIQPSYSNTVLLNKYFLIVGDPNYEGRKNTYSSVLIFKRNKGDYELIETIKSNYSSVPNQFGKNIAVKGSEIIITDHVNNVINRYSFVDSEITLLRAILNPNGEQEFDFGKNILLHEDYLFATSFSKSNKSNKRDGKVHVFKNENGTWAYSQTISPPKNLESLGFGENLSSGNNDIFISSNKSLQENEKGAIAQYSLQNGQWTLKSEIIHETKNIGFAQKIFANDEYLISTTMDTKVWDNKAVDTVGVHLDIYAFDKIQERYVYQTKLAAPQNLIVLSFGELVSVSGNKLYVGVSLIDGRRGVFVYEYNCINEWELRQRIIPKRQELNNRLPMSFSNFDNQLAIGSIHSKVNNYYDTEALGKGNVLMYAYKIDSNLIGHIKEIRENEYTTPSGKTLNYSSLFYDTIANKKGCDSIIEIDLTIFKKRKINNEIIIDTIQPAKSLKSNKEEREKNPITTAKSTTKLVELNFYDHGRVDHDIISIKLNEDWILLDQEIFKEPQKLYVLLREGHNYLLFRAENLGDDPPNTTRVEVTDGNGNLIDKFTMNSTLNESSVLRIDL